MNFNKCSRCGCFFMSDSNVCPNCEPKDKSEMSLLKNFLIDNGEENNTIESISASTGISVKNINRFLAQKEFSEFSNGLSHNIQNMNVEL